MPIHNISELHQKHKKEPLVIIGNGPSIIDIDVEKLQGVTMACNSKLWHPEFYTSEGYKPNPIKPKYVVFSEDQKTLKPSDPECRILFAENSCNLGNYSELAAQYHFYKFQINRTHLTESLKLSENPNWKALMRRVVPGITGPQNNSFHMVFGGLSTAISIAFWMGANPIHLVGFEGGPVDGRYHFWSKPTDTNNIYSQNEQMARRIFQGQIRYLAVCSNLFKACGVDLFCSTKGSKYLKALDYAPLP